MDQFDRQILNAIQHDTRLTSEKLSQLVGLSQDACRKRLLKLREEGVIEQEIAVLSPEKVGRGLVMVVGVTMAVESTHEVDVFKARMHEAPEVMQCYYVTGESDFIVILSVADMSDYETFVREHFLSGGGVASFRTNVVMDRVKVGFALPVLD